MSGAALGTKFRQHSNARDGIALHRLLRTTEAGSPKAQDVETCKSDDVAASVAKAWKEGNTEQGLEALCSALRQWSARYLAQPKDDPARWMLPPLLWLTARPRQLAGKLDVAVKKGRYMEKLVEVLREQFQKLQREKVRREGALAICCELLQLYFRLGQASQCSFLLAAVSQAGGGKALDLTVLPKALAVSLCFHWGKHCVLDGNVGEAEEKLGWALANCPPQASANRRRILTYLVPCRLRLGKFPSRGLLARHGLQGLLALGAAASSGDVQRFDKELESQETALINLGTYLVVEKLKLLCYRNLVRQVYQLSAVELEAQGKAEHRHKQDLGPYERAFEWQDSCSSDETICLLAHLIYIGAVRAYLSDEHRKIVFSKEGPFPAVASWCPKA